MTEMFEELLIRGESMETLKNIKKKNKLLKGSHSATSFLGSIPPLWLVVRSIVHE